MAKAVCVLDKVLSSYNGPLESVKAPQEIQNGQIYALGGRATITTAGSGTDASREVKDLKLPAAADIAKDVFVLHYSVPVNYAQGVQMLADGSLVDNDREDAFSVASGKIGRAYHLHEGDMITVADALINGATVVGQFVIPFADGTNAKTMAASATYTTERLVFRVYEKSTLGVGRRGLGAGQASTTLEVIKA